MKAEELRIGNFLKRQDGSVFSVTPEDIKYLSEYKNPFAPLPSPIPITEEWLLKFGYEKLSNFEESYMAEDYIWQSVVEKSPSIIIANGTFHEDNYGVELMFVHQLQNLFFSLTGKELVASI